MATRKQTIERILDKSGVRWHRAGDVPRPELIPTGIPYMDWVLGGIPKGRLTYVFGPEGAGKTTVAGHVARNCKGQVLWVDAEHGWDDAWMAHHVGDARDRIHVLHPGGTFAGEEVAHLLADVIGADEPPALVVIDSLAALTSSRVLDREFEKQLVGVDAMYNNRLVRVVNCVNRETAILVIGQYRESIGGYNYIPGGYGIRHLATMIVQLSGTRLYAADTDLSDLEDSKAVVGTRMRYKVLKNKLRPRYRQGQDLILDRGMVDLFDSWLRMGLETGEITKAGTWYAVPGTGKRVQGKAKLRAWTLEHPVEWNATCACIYQEAMAEVLNAQEA
jgi:recombination protein RecA